MVRNLLSKILQRDGQHSQICHVGEGMHEVEGKQIAYKILVETTKPKAT